MMHKQRPHKVCDVADLATLVDKLTQHTWTTCSAFSWRSLTLLNDATSEDGAQEYAVVRAGRQIESLTVSWMEPEKLRALLERLDQGEGGCDLGPVAMVPHPEGYCARCA